MVPVKSTELALILATVINRSQSFGGQKFAANDFLGRLHANIVQSSQYEVSRSQAQNQKLEINTGHHETENCFNISPQNVKSN